MTSKGGLLNERVQEPLFACDSRRFLLPSSGPQDGAGEYWGQSDNGDIVGGVFL